MAKFHLNTAFRETEVVVSANIELTLRDAKTLLWLTDRNPTITGDMMEKGITSAQVLEQNSESLRLMMRELALKILDSGIEMTSPSQLFEDLTGKEISDSFREHGS